MASKLKKTFAPGEVRTLSLRVTNEARRRQPIRFELSDVPDDWDVILDKRDIVLDGGADGMLNLSIRAPNVRDKQKVGMTLRTIPELEPDKTDEIVILAKLKPGKDGRKGKAVETAEEEGGGFGLFGRGGDDARPEPETTVIRRTKERPGPPKPETVVEYRWAPAITAGGLYHVTHVPLDDEGTVLRFREQVRLLCALCSSREVCFEGKFDRYMDRETFLESDHCLLMAGDFGRGGVEPLAAE